ncbi:hypothetical protein M9H77_26059 [Catharanthus roseus]|uniref:Uncharacterized protein n=1 Tax=Catharanthus roseus TaxID=4058 RepID=A0ACC0A922_CATRO|nr:hypothetical protein M9H77_26059 [Catharanthus roseus]
MIKHSSDNTAKDQKELIFDIIQDLPPEAQKRQLEKLKTLILREESSSARLIEPFSISKMFDRYPNLNPPIRQHSTTELQTEIRSLKAQVKELKERVFSIETKNLELDTQIALLQSRTSKGKEILPDSYIPDFPYAEIPMPDGLIPIKYYVPTYESLVTANETKNLELDTQIALLQSRTSKGKEILPDSYIPDFPYAEIPMPGQR